MLKFISHIITMLSLGTILYIFARALPRIDETEAQGKKIFARNHILFYYLEKIDGYLHSFSEKTLRKTGVVLMKLENKVNKKLTQIKKDSSNGSGNPLDLSS